LNDKSESETRLKISKRIIIHLQRALTSQIGMIEVALELKISNQFEIGSRMFICLQLVLGDRKSP